MPAAPSQQLERLRKFAERLVILVRDDGDPPTLEDETEAYEVLSIHLGSGARSIDAIKLRYRLDRTGQRLQDTGPPAQERRQVEVRRLDEHGEPTIIVAWGFLTGIELQVDGQQETLLVDARVENYAFGEPLRESRYYDPDRGALSLHLPCVFNPEIDGTILGNRSHRFTDTDYGPDLDGSSPWFFLHPESVRTPGARDYQQQEAAKWTLADAVHRLCWSCNPHETWIRNPSLQELQDVFGFSDDDVKNVMIDYGQYLPECLDQLLFPLGYAWYLRHALDEEGRRVTTLQFYRRGLGPDVELRLQRVGERFDFSQTDLDRFTQATNLASIANKITVRGGYPRLEGTFRLYPGWPGSEDDHDLADLEPGQPGAVTHPDVFRKWVLNEAKDYVDDREYPAGAPQVDFGDTDFAALFADDEFADDLDLEQAFPRRRRRLYPCLSQIENEQGQLQSREYVVEWWDREHTNDQGDHDAVTPDDLHDPGWTPVADPFSVLQTECGILFHSVPEALIDLYREVTTGTPPSDVEHPGLYLRITASVDADCRIERSRESDLSVLGETVELMLDLPDKFHFRQRSQCSVFHRDEIPADTADDLEQLEQYADRVLQTEDAARIACTINLPGVDHPDLSLGCVLRKISGREIDLRANSADDEHQRALQIVGLRLHFDGEQRTELILEDYRHDRDAVWTAPPTGTADQAED